MQVRPTIIFGVSSFVLVAMTATAMSTRAAPPSLAASAVTTSSDEVLSGENVIRRDVSREPSLNNSQMKIIQGTKSEDGACHYQVSFFASNNDMRPQMARQIAVDPITCRFQVEFGTPTTISQRPTGGTSRSSESSGGK